MKRQLPILTLLIGCLSAATGLSAQTPVAYYGFSGTAKDVTAFANHASVQGASLTQDRFGWANSAMFFDGTQGALTAPHGAQLNSGSITIGFWINPSAFPAQGEVYLLSHGGWQERWKISLPSHGKPVFTTHANGACCSDMDAGTPLPLDTWTHVTMVHDGTKDRIYYNGVQVNEKDVTGDLDPTTFPLGIGWNPIDGNAWFHGSLDEVAIVDGALSALQIAALYAAQSTAPPAPNSIVARYSFDGNGEDGSGFGNHAVSVGTAQATDRFGYGHAAFHFDGAGAEVTAPGSAYLNSAHTTIRFWVKPNSFPASGEVYLLSHGGWQERWKISLPNHGKPVFTTHAAGACCSDMDAGTPLPTDAWTQVVMVHDGTKDRIYYNGSQVNEKDVTGDLDPTGFPLGIGYNPIDGGGWFDGSIDEVEIFDYALSATDIADQYALAATFPGNTTNRVAAYELDGNGTDASQFANHADLTGGGTAVPNRHGWGGNAYQGAAVAANSAALQSDHTTISCWVKPNSFPASGEVFLLSNGGWQERWKISLPNHGKPVFTTHAGGACCSDMDAGTPLPLDTWSHLAFVHDGTKDRIYLNGVQVNEKDAPGALDKTRHPLGIGFDPIDGSGFFDGALDDVLVFNEALGATEIAALFAEQDATPAAIGPLVAHYAFSGNSLDGTGYRNNASPAPLRKDRFGKANKAAAFNGNTEVTAANSPQLNSPHTSVSFWVKPNSLPGNGEVFLLSFGGWQERWKISLPGHGKPVWTTNHTNGISDMDSGDGNALPLDAWTHVVMVHDGAKNIIYFNGNPVAEKDVVGDLDNTSFPLGIGYNPIDGGNWFDGYLDEVQVYNQALSAADVAALHAEQAQAPAGGDDEAPCAPLNLNAEVVFNHVSLSWLPATDNVGVTAYNVWQDGIPVATTTATHADFPGLAPLTDFVFAVSAVDADGNESLPTSLLVTTGPDQSPDLTPPTIPGNLQGQPGFNSVLLSWDASTDDTQVAGYIVWVDGTYFDSLPANTLSVLVTGLEPETAYSFEVAAFDLAGNTSDKAELTLETTEPLDTGEPGLVAHYPFDGNADDATPYQNHGVIGGNPVFENVSHPNGSGQAIRFDGDQDSVLAANAVQLLSDYTTVSFWIRVDNVNTQDAEAYVMDFGHWDQRWKISLPQHRKPVWTTNSNNIQFPNFISDMDSGDGNELVIGLWSYITMVHDGTNDLIYKDGVLANQKPAAGKLNTTARPLCFGNNPIEGGQYFPGALDDVKIYNRAVTAEEAAQLYQTGALTSTDEPALAAVYVDQVFPNPARHEVTIRHRLPAGEELLVRVFDTQGRQLDALRLAAADVATGSFSLPVGHYPAGLYTLNLVLGGKNLGAVRFSRQ